MKIHRHTFFRRNENGMIATIVFIALLAIMVLLVAANGKSLFRLHREIQLLEHNQIKRFDASQTNSIGRIDLPVGQDARQRVPTTTAGSK